jgi:hypothetical protein
VGFTKIELKKQLNEIGIKVIKGNYIRKKDVYSLFPHKVKAAWQLPSLGKYPMIVAYLLDPLNRTPDPEELTPYDLEEFIENAASELNIEIDLSDDFDLDLEEEEKEEEKEEEETEEEQFEASPVAKQIYADYLRASNFQKTLPTDAQDAFAYLYLVVDAETGAVLCGGSAKEDLKEDVVDYREAGKKTKIISRGRIKPDAFADFFNKFYS